MSMVMIMLILLLTSPLGRTFVMERSEKEVADSAVSASSVQRSSRCQRVSLQTIRESLLQGLNLQQEPQPQSSWMAELREQWKAALKASGHSSAPIQSPLPMTGNGQHPDAPATELQCCMLSSQVFIKDLGWENWVIYPESFTFTQCSACIPQPKPSEPLCPSAPTAGATPQVPCCQPIAHDMVPFFYLDKSSTLVISSVPMTRQCGCGQGSDSHAPRP
ncbi:gonadal somatic cell derived factor [Sardina pilchardus]|uniref:gonadal somatic cell derived factor n=1 Tax=Sardina pilchardus TaxID=27697 RepID=UPI002E11DD53